jgi:hypothetical protein
MTHLLNLVRQLRAEDVMVGAPPPEDPCEPMLENVPVALPSTDAAMPQRDSVY